MSSERMAEFLREVASWRWDQFVRAEKDKNYTSNQAIIFSLIRACAMRKLPAIKVAIDRMDGKLKTPVKIEMPKVYYIYPNAVIPAKETDDWQTKLEKGTGMTFTPDASPPVTGELMPAVEVHETANDSDLPSMTFRETLAKMSDYPRELPEQLVLAAEATHAWIERRGPEPPEIPMVKSVVAAHLLIMAQERNMDAIGEVFNAIDGKLVETIQLLGDDIYIVNYAAIAPDGATPNKDGILQIEATDAQNTWAQRLDNERKK